jgi:predicted Holliday junction resolvase-like endonuclease
MIYILLILINCLALCIMYIKMQKMQNMQNMLDDMQKEMQNMLDDMQKDNKAIARKLQQVVNNAQVKADAKLTNEIHMKNGLFARNASFCARNPGACAPPAKGLRDRQPRGSFLE